VFKTRVRAGWVEWFRDEPGRPSFDWPGHGEHSEAIIASLGYDARELAALKARGVY
jgi:crotonobetainyl-CoA:carnitine CoA-transferase CaiB-like acyl-CoA transferase